MTWQHLSLGLLVAAFAGCAADAEPVVAASADVPKTPAVQAPAPGALVAAKPSESRLGAPITETADTSLADIAKDPRAFAGKTVRTSGEVLAVCKAAGCWMEIGDTAQRAHIKMAGHAFYVPKSAAGRRAVVQGTVKAGEPENECGQADRCGGSENGALAKLEIVATGVELLD